MLITCPECGHQVSDQAKTCPSCGIEIAGNVVPGNAGKPGNVVTGNAGKPGKTDKRQPRKGRTAITVLIVSFVIALILVLLGLYFMKNQEQKNELRAYENAMKSTEPLVLENYLDMYADAPGVHRDSIRLHLEAFRRADTDWADALVSNSRYAFERFLKMHPQSIHSVEADIKIDSLDWVAALQANTIESIQAYLNRHNDGAYYDEARAQLEQLENQKVTADDRQMVIQTCTAYFNALAQMDEGAIAAAVAPVMTSFLHRANATKDDVIQYMQKVHEPDINSMEFTPNGDWNVEKLVLSEGHILFKTTFTVAQNIERSDESRENSAVYKVTAVVNPDHLITELNMKRSVQP